jgi:RNA polymerase sigma-70 factor (ECF subfamily)
MSNANPPEPVGCRAPTPVSLLERAKKADQAAWQGLVELYRPLVSFWCRRTNLPEDAVEDVVQNVFLCIVRDLKQFQHDGPSATFRGWLRVVTRNQIALHFRRNEGEPVAQGGEEAFERLQEVPDPLSGPVAGEEEEMGQLYRRALGLVRCEFEEKTWQAFWKTVIEDRLPATLVGELGMSANAIRQARSRVSRRIKEELGDLGDLSSLA